MIFVMIWLENKMDKFFILVYFEKTLLIYLVNKLIINDLIPSYAVELNFFK